MEWLFHLGVIDEVLEEAEFIPKSYGFFRDAIDDGVDDERIAELAKFMLFHQIISTNHMTEHDWRVQGDDYLRDLMLSGNEIEIPDFLRSLTQYPNIVLMGGAQQQCLKEIEIGLMALNKSFEFNRDFVY